MTQPTRSQSSPPLIPALLLFGGMTLLLMALFSANPSQKPGAVPAVLVTEMTEAPTLPEPTQAVAVASVLDPGMVTAGETIFQTVCAACHGFNAMGIVGLGKTLVGSEYVNGLTDEELLHFINVGRDVSDPLNTTGVTMPAKGGNPGLTDGDLLNVIAYIRSLNAPAGTVAVQPTPVPEETGPTATPYEFVPLPLTASDSGSESANLPNVETASVFSSVGEQLYVQNCSGCHGVDSAGLPYLAPSLADSQLLADQDGIAIELFLTDAHSPLNPETGFPHPYRGGYPELNDEQIRAVIGYLYTLNP